MYNVHIILREVIELSEQDLEKLVNEKFKEADENFKDRPKKFFVVENGRGVVDGGELYNHVYTDVLRVTKEATLAILKEALK